jgi:hypothetical protein
MQARRFTLTVPDERGRPQRGEVLLAQELAAQRRSDPTRRPRAVLDASAISRARK